MTKTAVITGASSGVGKASAQALIQLGWRVIGIGRDPARCAAAEADINSPSFTMLRADFDVMADVARVADVVSDLTDHVDALVNNAGGVRADQLTTIDGFEATFASNHLAGFLLTKKLLPLLRKNGARVSAVSSDGHEHCPAMKWDDLHMTQGWSSGGAYCQAKLANVLFARELARREGANGIISHAMHPGVVDSNFVSHCEPGMKAYMESINERAKPPTVAAETIVWLAQGQEPDGANGRYFHLKAELPAAPAAMDDEAAARLWAVSEEMLAGF